MEWFLSFTELEFTMEVFMLKVFEISSEYYFFITLSLAILTLVTFILLRKFFHKAIMSLFKKLGENAPTLLEEINIALKTPLEFYWLCIGLLLTLYISPFVKFVRVDKPNLVIGESINFAVDIIPVDFVNACFHSATMLFLAWCLYNSISIYERILVEAGSKFTLLDNALLIRFCAKVARLIIVVTGLIFIISPFISNIGAIVTGVGLGGVAFTFIAKDTLEDILSGIVLMVDRPFSIKDWIEFDEVEGFVEDVSFRSTRVRTFTQGLVIVPNKILSTSNITNWSAMPKRRIRFELSLNYNTDVKLIEEAIIEYKNLLNSFKDVENDTHLVFLNEFADCALELRIMYYTPFIDLRGYSRVRGEVNLAILQLTRDLGLDIAFPTQTIILENEARYALQIANSGEVDH
ncbi:MAG: hypothetical protein ATN36_08035 [Epulopiscium sp. Nele67-Bin005]|nr:MAG: hypothetical protein ATN36_08035 [Epulopiscium sp. Nele67-Bin005]